MISQLESTLISYANHMPLEVFSPLASFVEEVIAIIPSPAVMIVTGSIASLQGKTFYYLFLLSVLGSIGKLAGSLVVYFISDKIEDYFSGILKKFFGVTHEDVESFGKKFSGNYWDYIILFIMRAIPVIPSSVVSIGSGIIRVPLKLYILSTFLGTVFRDFIYIYFGYSGIIALGNFIKKSQSVESWIQLIFVLSIFILFAWFYFRRLRKVKA